MRIVGTQRGKPGILRRLMASACFQGGSACMAGKHVSATTEERRPLCQRRPHRLKPIWTIFKAWHATAARNKLRSLVKFIDAMQNVIGQKYSPLEAAASHVGKKHQKIRPAWLNAIWTIRVKRTESILIPYDVAHGVKQHVARQKRSLAIIGMARFGTKKEIAVFAYFRMQQ